MLDEIYKVVPKDLLQVFDAEEMEMILYGVPFIDIDEWREQTIYDSPYSPEHMAIKWFWNIVKELDQEQLGKFLQYCTGSTRIPVNGFR
jgi:E3 ubiquitin-protein ligase HUWE1